MRKTLAFFLSLLALLTLCACGASEPVPTPTPAPTPTPTPAPLTEKDLWADRVMRHWNMDYESFGEYWSLICDGYFGDELPALLHRLSGCANVDYSEEDYNAQIEAKRAEYAQKYGSDWHFSMLDVSFEPIEERAKEDFAAELQKLYESISVLTNEAALWGEEDWGYFAEGLGCGADTAKEVVSLYAAIGEKCNACTVTEAYAVKLAVDFAGETTGYETWVYKLGEVYVSQELIDNTLALINLIY